MSLDISQVCIVPRLTGVGGMVSFQGRLSKGLRARGIQVNYNLEDAANQAVLVVGGTRHLSGLWRARQRGVPIIQRLDGMNWLHRRLRTGLRHFMRAEYGNMVLRIIRSRLADRIVYQSQFSKTWWEREHGPAPAPDRVVYNGIDLMEYSPIGGENRPTDRWRVLLVEGSLMGGYEMGLDAAVRLVEGLASKLDTTHRDADAGASAVELVVVGRVAEKVQSRWQGHSVTIKWEGLVEGERIPEIDRSAHLLYSADLNAACPNAVVEALACGLPVLAFDTGALPEMVTGSAGQVVPYGGNPWRLEAPDYEALVEAAMKLLQNQETYRSGARQRAEEVFDLDRMVEAYLQALVENG